MSHENSNHPIGKTVYFVDNQSFESDKGLRNGRKKAEEYCLNNFINYDKIIKFDSRTERDRYLYLRNKEGITDLEVHKVIQLTQSKENANGDLIPAYIYTSDFTYREFGKLIVEDVKGSTYFINDEFRGTKIIVDNVLLSKNTYLKVILKDREGRKEWRWGDVKKSSLSSKKAKAENQKLKKENHNREILENKLNRDKERFIELSKKEKLSSTEKKRLAELEEKLKNVGVIITR